MAGFDKDNRHNPLTSPKTKRGGNFYFGLFSLVLFGFLFFGSPSLAHLTSFNGNSTIALSSALQHDAAIDNSAPFFGQTATRGKETPDLKIIQDSFVFGVAPSHVITTQTYATVMGGPTQTENRTEIIDDYEVGENETVTSIAAKFGLHPRTVADANDISTTTPLKVGQRLIILQTDGYLYTVKSGDTVGDIATTYNIKAEEIVAFNEIADGRIFKGDSLFLPGAKKLAKVVPAPAHIVLPNTFFLSPLLHFTVTQSLHPNNAVDLGAPCGASIYASASGVVEVAGYNRIGGNRVIISHGNGTDTYYGHIAPGGILVKPGDQVIGGDRIGLVGKTGKATGCHVHYGVDGAKNPFAKYFAGTVGDASSL